MLRGIVYGFGYLFVGHTFAELQAKKLPVPRIDDVGFDYSLHIMAIVSGHGFIPPKK